MFTVENVNEYVKSYALLRSKGLQNSTPVFTFNDVERQITYYPKLKVPYETIQNVQKYLNTLIGNLNGAVNHTITLERFLTRQCKFDFKFSDAQLHEIAIKLYQIKKPGKFIQCKTRKDYIEMFKVSCSSCMSIPGKDKEETFRGYMYRNYNVWPSIFYKYAEKAYNFNGYTYYKDKTPLLRLFETDTHVLHSALHYGKVDGDVVKQITGNKPMSLQKLRLPKDTKLIIPSLFIKECPKLSIIALPYADFLIIMGLYVSYDITGKRFILTRVPQKTVSPTYTIPNVYALHNYLGYQRSTNSWLSAPKIVSEYNIGVK